MGHKKADKYLTIEEIEIFSLLESYHEYWGVWPSNELIARKLGKAIYTPMKKLIRKGLLSKKMGGVRTYTLNKALYGKMLDRFLDVILYSKELNLIVQTRLFKANEKEKDGK